MTNKKLSKKNDWSYLYTVGYLVFKDWPARILPFSKRVKDNLETAGMKTNYTIYVSAMLFWSITLTVLSYILTPILVDLNSFALDLTLIIGISPSLLGPEMIHILLTVLAGASTLIVFYAIPLYIADKVKRRIEKNLVYVTNFMAIMASGGATSEEIFTSLAEVGDIYGIASSGEYVLRSVDLLGKDIMTAIDHESKRSPSKDYGSFLQGFLATVRKGGDLRNYLDSMAEKHIEDRRRQLNKLFTQLNFMAEIFIIVLVAFPIIMIVLLTVMENSGGGSILGGISPTNALNLMTYLIVPIAAVGVLFLTDVIMGNQ